MASTINTNLAAQTAQRGLMRTQSDLATSIARLSSGLRINSARDDAAGLAISARFQAQIRGTSQAARNANDGISLAQTAEGALGAVSGNLQRMRELAVQAANGSHSAVDRTALQLEVAQLQSEIDRVATQTAFNGTNLLDGSFAAKAFQIGANAGQTLVAPSIGSARTTALGTFQGVRFHESGGVIPGYAPQAFSVSIGGGPTISLGTVAVDVKAEAAAINNANIPGLSASGANTRVPTGVSTAGASGSGSATFFINGVAIGLTGTSGGAGLAGNRTAAVAAINAQSAQTGVIATDTGAGVSLVAADGRNVATSYAAGTFAGSSEADFGLWAAGGQTVNGDLSYDYDAPAGVTGAVFFTNGPWNSTHPIVTLGTSVDTIDVSTQSGANTALASLDRALATVASNRASLGAVQNRFASVIANLQTSGENLAASQSRIEDADFAMETANLSRAQVLQNAGTAMVAQANQLPQQVLQLLR